MKIYLVGGAVRDKKLGLPVKERDYVVVGATVADMQKQGFRQVGKEFPVFIHPKTGEEYALARMERKVKPGYQGFTFDTSPDVTLEEDLLRRDLTINAMAEEEGGRLIDPYHGEKDLQDKILRHVSPAFAEDPVRILRIARFYARFAHLGFTVADETMQLMRKMVTAGEVDALVAERVWKELERALGEINPEKFFAILNDSHALPILFPELTWDDVGLKALQSCTTTDSLVRFAALFHHVSLENKALAKLCDRYRVPNDYRELALLTAKWHEKVLRADALNAEELLHLLSAVDVFRREERFQLFLMACEAIAISQQKDTHFMAKLTASAKVVKSYDVQLLLAEGFEGQALAEKLREKRLEVLSKYL